MASVNFDTSYTDIIGILMLVVYWKVGLRHVKQSVTAKYDTASPKWHCNTKFGVTVQKWCCGQEYDAMYECPLLSSKIAGHPNLLTFKYLSSKTLFSPFCKQ